MGVGVSQQTPAISFYNVYKIYKEKHRPQPAKPQHVTRVYVVKKPVKCRQETRKIRGRNTSRNGAKCRQKTRNATNKTGPDGVGLFLFVIPVLVVPVRRGSPCRCVSNCKPLPLSRWCTFGTSGTPPPVGVQTMPVNVSCRVVCSFVGCGVSC